MDQTESAVKAVGQAGLKQSGGCTPDLLRSNHHPSPLGVWTPVGPSSCILRIANAVPLLSSKLLCSLFVQAQVHQVAGVASR